MSDVKNALPLSSSREEEVGFLRTVAGRLVSAAAGFSLFTIGALAIEGSSSNELTVLASAPLVAIVTCVVAVGFAIHANRYKDVIAMILVLPFLAGITLAGMTIAAHMGTWAGVIAAGIGGLLMLSSAIGTRHGFVHTGHEAMAGHRAH